VTSTEGFDNDPNRGIASLYFNGKTLRFRTNPNEIWWSYSLNTVVEQTYGGRVVQILGTKIDDLVIKIDCGRGGWTYLMQVVEFLKEMMLEQRKDGGKSGVFSYTTRNWRLKVYALSVPFQDSVTATVRELELRFKVVEDLTGEISQATLSSELARLRDGIGFEKGEFNTPAVGLALSGSQVFASTPALGSVLQAANALIPSVGIPGTP